MMLTRSTIQMGQYLLMVMCLHLGVVQLHEDQSDKQLLQDHQWNFEFIALEMTSSEVE